MSARTWRTFATLIPLVLLQGGCALNPTPLTEDQLATTAADLRQRVVAEQEPIAGPVGLFDALARALKYNLDHRVEQYEHALRLEELRVAGAAGLPSLVASAGLANRDDPAGSSSYNLVTNTQNFGYSTSQDLRLRTRDLTFSWNILDFGLSYVRAKQAADKALIAEEARRKVSHRIMEEVRTAYWKAVSAERLDQRLARLEARTKRALSQSKTLADQRQTSPVTAITYRRELIEVLRTVQELRRELTVAKSALAALMNVKPGTRFALVLPKHESIGSGLGRDSERLIGLALQNRPELRDVAYRRRINSVEAKAALLELLPGIQLFAGLNYDSNSYLLHQDWVSWGAKASWNVMKLFQHPAKSAAIDAQDQLLDQRALAVTMAVMTQVHVSGVRYQHYLKELETARTYLKTQTELVGQLRAEHAAERVSEQTLIREELAEMVAEVRADIMAANVHGAQAAIVTAVGLDLAPDVDPRTTSVRDLAQNLRATWGQRATAAGGNTIAQR